MSLFNKNSKTEERYFKRIYKVWLSLFIIGITATNPAFAEVILPIEEPLEFKPEPYLILINCIANWLIPISIIGVIVCIINIVYAKTKLKIQIIEIKKKTKMILLIFTNLLLIMIVLKILFWI